MSACLKIQERLFNSDRLISALVQYKLLEPLIGHVLMDEAIKEIALSKQEVFRALAGETDAPIPENFEEFLADWCDRQNVTSAYFNDVVLRELRIEKFKQVYFAGQVESEFLRTKSEVDQVEYSLIQLQDLCLAQELYFQLRDDGADFAQLAQAYSVGKERDTQGWVGPVPMSRLPVEIATLFRSGTVGAIYGPVAVADLFWIVRLERLIPARLSAAVSGDLVEQLYTRWLRSQVKKLISMPGSIVVQTDDLQRLPTSEALAEPPAEQVPSA